MGKDVHTSQDVPDESDERTPSAGAQERAVVDKTRDASPEAAVSLAAGDGAELDPESETDVWTGRTHWKHFMGRFSLWALGNIVVLILLIWLSSSWDWLTGGRVFWSILAIFVVSGILVAGPVALTILGHRYRLTTQRLFIRRGILSQTVDQTELIRVDDVRLHKSFLDRLFGLGTVAIRSTDATDQELLIEGIAEPEKVAEAIRTRMRMMRRKSLFVENL